MMGRKLGKKLAVTLISVFLFCMAGTALAADVTAATDNSSNNASTELKAELQDMQLRIKVLEAALAAKKDEPDKKDKSESELTNLDVRVNTLEKKSDKLSDKLSISGFLHLSDQVWNNSGNFKRITAKTG